MAPRLSKRQQRALDELEDLSHTGPSTPDDREASEDEQELKLGKRTQSGFAALLVQDNGDDDDNEEEKNPAKSGKSKKSKKKKKTGAGSGTGNATPVQSTSIEPLSAAATTSPKPDSESTKLSPSEKKAFKKAKAKARKEKEKADDGLDEIDRALEELSMKHPEFKAGTAASSAGIVSSSSGQNQTLLTHIAPQISVSLSHLDSSAELRRFFGSKVVKASNAQDSPGRGHASSSRKQPATERSNLTRPQPGWAPAKMREGLSLRVLDEEELARKKDSSVPGERWWTVEYGRKYKSVTKMFLRIVGIGDPQGFYDLMYRNPWHSDTLLQLSEVYRHRDEHAQAIDLIERAIFSYERAFLGMGSFNFTSGVNRLDFDRVENRVFYMAVHRVVADLTRRGLTRTAFEFARLLYSLDPWTDPHGAIFHLEFLASKGMSGWMEDVSEIFERENGVNGTNEKVKEGSMDGKVDPTILPGWTWSRAVVMRLGLEDVKDIDEREELDRKSTAALVEAIKSFPSVIPLLADKIDATIPNEVRALKECRIAVDGSGLSQEESLLHLLSHLYVQRAFSLWKTPSITSWFARTVSSFASEKTTFPPTPRRIRFLKLYSSPSSSPVPTKSIFGFPGSSPSTPNPHAYAVWRHLIILESTYRSLFKFIPKSVLEAATTSLSCDPLPPPTRISEYDERFFVGISDNDMDDALGVNSRRRTRAQREADERRLAQLVPDANFRRQINDIFNANPVLAERIPGGVFEFAQRLANMPPDLLDDLMAHAAAQQEAGVGEGQNIFVGDGEMPGGFGAVQDGEGGLPDFEPENQGHDDARDEDEDEEYEGEDEEIAPMPVRMIRNLIGRFNFWGGGDADSESDGEADEERQRLRDDAGVD